MPCRVSFSVSLCVSLAVSLMAVAPFVYRHCAVSLTVPLPVPLLVSRSVSRFGSQFGAALMSPTHISHPSLRNECVTCAGSIPGSMCPGQRRRAASAAVPLWPTASGGVGGENVLAVKRLWPTASGGSQLLQRFIVANGVGRRQAASGRFGGFIVANGVGRRRASSRPSERAGWRWLAVPKTHCYLKPHCRFSGFSIPGRAWRPSGFSVHGSMQILRFLRSVRRRGSGGFSAPGAPGGVSPVSPRPAGARPTFFAASGARPRPALRNLRNAPGGARRSETTRPPGGDLHSETSETPRLPGGDLHSETSETAWSHALRNLRTSRHAPPFRNLRNGKEVSDSKESSEPPATASHLARMQGV